MSGLRRERAVVKRQFIERFRVGDGLGREGDQEIHVAALGGEIAVVGGGTEHVEPRDDEAPVQRVERVTPGGEHGQHGEIFLSGWDVTALVYHHRVRGARGRMAR